MENSPCHEVRNSNVILAHNLRLHAQTFWYSETKKGIISGHFENLPFRLREQLAFEKDAIRALHHLKSPKQCNYIEHNKDCKSREKDM